jgi:chemotaxis protein methyltransferase CheR
MGYPRRASVPHCRNLTLHKHEYQRIRDLVQTHCGLHLTEEKQTLIMNRLYTHVTSQGFPSYGAYIDDLEADTSGLALDHLVSLIATNHTSFFREEAHFVYLQTHVLPDIERQLQRTRDNDLRIWCAAASTGEEAYSMMITLFEYFGPRYARFNAGLLATDISMKALHKAARGVYTAAQVHAVPPVLRERYFRRSDEHQYAVLPALKAEVVFRKFNLMTARYPFKKPFHIIFCRNVMMYFDAPTRRKLVQKLYDCTSPGGYVFSGHAETIEREDRRYEYVRPAVYRKSQ